MGLLSATWSRIQTSLFPFLEEELGPLDERKRSLVWILELIRIEDSVSQATHHFGHPPSNRKVLARAFVAKVVYNCPTTREGKTFLLEQRPNLVLSLFSGHAC
ncbi:MAG: hypothetical protein V1800_15625 [Candidatus Latescibacterota bacterium]